MHDNGFQNVAADVETSVDKIEKEEKAELKKIKAKTRAAAEQADRDKADGEDAIEKAYKTAKADILNAPDSHSELEAQRMAKEHREKSDEAKED